MKHPRLAVWLAVVALSSIFYLQGAASLRLKAPTFDEVTYFGIGQYELLTGRFDVPGAGTHPPLSFYLSSLPLLTEPLQRDAWTYTDEEREQNGWTFTLVHDQIRGQKLFARDSPQDRLLNRGRLTVLGLAFLLGPLVFSWSRRCFGTGPAFVSLTLFAFDPNLIAHARLITPDFTLVALYFAASFFAATAGHEQQRWRWVVAGLFTGLALLTKHSALALAPVVALPFLLDQSSTRTPPQRLRILAAAAAIAAGVLIVGYQLQPLQYLTSLQMQLSHASSGHRAFLFGEISEQGWWYYHLAAMAVKTPIPLLVLVVATLLSGLHRRLPRHDLVAMALPPIALLALFCVIRGPNIGIRYVLPVYPFLFVLAGGAAAFMWERKGLRVALVLLLAWQVTGTLRVYPDYLAYFNEAAGGPSGGRAYLVDSNLDWGQDLKQLKSYIDRNGIGRVRLSYFGAADPAMYDIDYSPLPGYYLGSGLGPPLEWRGTFVISATNLAGIYLDRDFFARLRVREPDAVIGHSLLIFELDGED